MKTYKEERDWSDLARADKIVLLAGVLLWAGLSVGILKANLSNIQKQIAKTELLRQR